MWLKLLKEVSFFCFASSVVLLDIFINCSKHFVIKLKKQPKYFHEYDTAINLMLVMTAAETDDGNSFGNSSSVKKLYKFIYVRGTSAAHDVKLRCAVVNLIILSLSL